MKAVLKKLNNKRGVSIMLALFLFIICALAGTAAVTSANANRGRYAYLRHYQQEYLAVTSAAELIKGQMEAGAGNISATFTSKKGEITVEQYVYEGHVTGTNVTTQDTFYYLIWDYIKTFLYNQMSYEVDKADGYWNDVDAKSEVYNKSFTVSVDAPPEDSGIEVSEDFDVTVDVTDNLSDPDNVANKMINFKLSCGDCTICFSVDVGITAETEIKDEAAETRTMVVRLTKCQLSDSKMRVGD